MAELITNGGFNGNDGGWNVGTGWTYEANSEAYQVDSTGSIVVVSGFPVDGSTGYLLGETLTFDGGDGNATCVITGIGPDGHITGVRITNPGTGYPSGGSFNMIGGSGTGTSLYVPFIGTRGLSQQIATVGGQTYYYSIDVNIGPATQQFVVMMRGPSEDQLTLLNNFSTSGTHTGDFQANDNNEFIYIYAVGGPFTDPPPWTGNITNVSVSDTAPIGRLSQDVPSINSGDRYRLSLSISWPDGGDFQRIRVYQGTQQIFDND